MFVSWNYWTRCFNKLTIQIIRIFHLKSLHPRMLCAKFGWNCPTILEKILKCWYIFCYVVIISPWKRVLRLNKFDSPPPKDALCQVSSLVVIGPVVLEEKIFFNFVNLFSLFRNYLPLEKGGALHLYKLESPTPKNALCQVGLKLVQWFWRRWWKYEKFTTTTKITTKTDKFWSKKLTLAQVS